MNYRFIFILFSLFITKSAISQTYRAALVTQSEKGEVTLDIWDTKSGKRYKLEDARKNAVAFVILNHLGSDGRNPVLSPLVNSPNAQREFENYRKDFLSRNGDYGKYVITTDFSNSTLPEIAGPKDWKVYRVCIARNELREHLEEMGVLEKLNKNF
jgi:hypothetical protein